MIRKTIVSIFTVILFLTALQGISKATDYKMYWTQGREILRGNPDGTNVETLVTGRNPSSLALDVAGNRMYWIDHAYNSIFKATLDGKNVEKIITGLSNTPGTIALDTANNKIYWTDPGNQKIQRANLDGSDSETIIEGQGNLYGLALDVGAGKMYWSRYDYIYRTNLDGSDSEVIIDWSSQIYDIVLDVIAGKMYLINRGSIHSVNLNGSDGKVLVNAPSAQNFSLDIENGKIYWIEPNNKKIRRANLDGTSAHNLFTGLDDLRGIALDPSALPPTVPAGNVPPSTDSVGSVTPPTEPTITTPPLVAATDLELSHGGDVRCVAYSPAGIVLASGGMDDTIHLWRASTGELLNTLDSHSGDVNSIAFSPNDTYIASGSDDGKVILYKWSPAADTWVTTETFNIPGGTLANNVKSVAFSHDSTMLACGTSGNNVFIYDYDPDAGEWVYRETLHGHSGTVNSVAFSPWGVVLASSSDDGTVRLWRARTGEHLATLDRHTADVNSVAFSRDDTFIASGSDDDTVILWKWSAVDDTWVHHRTLDRHTDDVRSVAFNANGSLLVSASADKTIGVWDGQTGAYQTSLTEHTGGVNSVAYNFQGNAIASGSDDGTVRQLAHTESTDITDKGIGLTVPSGLISDVAFGPKSTYFVLNAQYPTLTGISASEVVYKSCKITIDLPGVPDEAVSLLDIRNSRLDNPNYYMFPLKTPRERIGEVTAELGAELTVEIAGLIPIAGDAAGALWETGKAALAIHAILQSTADPTVTLRVLNLSGQAGRPANQWPSLFLLQDRVSSIGIKVEQKYARKSETKQFWFDPTYTVTYEGTWNLADGTLAAPSMQLMTLADYPPFQQLPPEVQEYLRRHFREFMTVGRWQIPETTALLPNYPNPFNPETWIPYQLAKPADVTLTIYDITGHVVRNLDLGHQRAGMYHSRSRAAYWDGRNAVGEPVASGLYFYVLKAGDFSATRKMLIKK